MLIGTIVVATLAATLAATPPSPAGPNGELGIRTLRLLEANAQAARRARFLFGSVGLALGGAQVGLGLYAREAFDEPSRHAGTGMLIGGAIVAGTSLLPLVTRSDAERLRRSADYRALAANPDDPRALRNLQAQWASAAGAARIARLVIGSMNLAGGLAMTGIGSYYTFNSGASDRDHLLGLGLGGAGLGLAATGVYSITLPSPTEKGWRDYRHTTGLSQRPRISISPTVGGAVVAGRF